MPSLIHKKNSRKLSSQEINKAETLLKNFSKKLQDADLYPDPNDFCPCGSRKKYKKCCFQDEHKPFVPLEKELTILPDDDFFGSEHKLKKHFESLDKGKAQEVLSFLEELQKTYPNNSKILFLFALGHRLDQNFKEAEKILMSTKGSHFFPLRLMRWWHILEWGPQKSFAALKNITFLKKLAPQRQSFFLTEFCLWGIIRILDAAIGNRFVEAESHFLSIAKVAATKGRPKHWAIEEAVDILESAYFLRRLTLLNKGERIGKK